MEKALSLLLKLVSSSCNLKCKYCFYIDEASCREVSNMGIMDENTVSHIIDKAFNYSTLPIHITFNFQGGEPLLVGPSF